MSQLAADLRRFNEWQSALRQPTLRSIAMLAVPWLLALLALCFGWASASAQTTTGCLPYSTNYPCIYVANLVADVATSPPSTVSAINASTNTVFGGPIPVSDAGGSGATAVAVTPNNAFTYVALRLVNRIAVIDNSTNSMTAAFPLAGQQPYYAEPSASQIAFSPDGAFAWVTVPSCYGCNTSVQAIDTSTIDNDSPVIYTVATGAYPPLVNPAAIVLSPDGTKAYVADSCPNSACIDVIDTTKRPYTVTSQIQLPGAIPFSNASIAITPDGSLVCVSINLDSTDWGVTFLRTSDNTVLPAVPTFSQVPASNYGMGITQDGTLYLAIFNGGIVLVNTGDQTLKEVIQVGSSPTGIAIAPDGATVYVTDSVANTVSVLKGGLAIASIPNVGNQPQGIAIMPSLPPTIVTQPASQTIGSLQSATLSVTATGTPPLTYQWYQGQSGDTSTPISGATGNSYTTPAALTATTSYWVAVSNPVTNALSTAAPSTTAAVMPTLLAPTCKLTLQATSSFFTVTATANCTDPQLQPLVTSLSWGTAEAPIQTNGGSLVATKTLTPAAAPYPVTVTSTDTSQLIGSTTLSLVLPPIMSVFAGQAANVSFNVLGQSSGTPISVSFQCTSVIASNGPPRPPSDLGISCVSTPPVITLGQSPQSVTIAIQTTGAATTTTIARNVQHDDWTYALLLPFSALLWLGTGRRTARARRTGFTCLSVFACGVMLLLSTSCGGGFTSPPKVTQLATPPGNYQITIVESCLGGTCQNFTGFVQTTLIVPLTVSPTQ